MNMIFKF